MSKGSPVVPIRLVPFVLERLDAAIAKNNTTRREEPWNRTTWIVDAILAKLAHQSRAEVQREKKRRKKELAKRGHQVEPAPADHQAAY